MPRGPAKKAKTEDTSQSLESKLWATADKLRGHLDAADYKHVVLGLIFLKYISDRFAQRHAEILSEGGLAGGNGADPEDRDEYTAEGVFWVPASARWPVVQAAAKQTDIGKRIDDAMTEIERENPKLKGILPKGYARPTLDQRRLGELVDLIGTIGLGTAEHQARDTLGRVYEYFLGRFASAEGKRGGEFYTPASVVRTLVTMLAPYKGRIYDPCCGSGGMFVQSEKFIEAHGGKVGDISVYGQESNPNTWKLALMNLAIRGIEADLGPEAADTFHKDLHPDLRADYILANPPFNISDWGGDLLRDDKRWQYGVPPTGNANFAWVQHMVHHLAPYGIAGFVLANGSMSSNTSGEGEIRKNLIEADLVDCMVALPGQLFYSTPIPVCLWFLAKNRDDGRGMDGKDLYERTGEVLFIDARNMGYMADRTHRELSDEDIQKIADTYHNWRGDGDGEYADVPGFCKAAGLDEIRKNGHVLTPGRYVGVAAKDDDDEPFEEKMARLTKELSEQFAEGRRLEDEIRKNLGMLGYEL
ncbi:SAM-dependent DNA methyltransferase [Acidithiobacillus caldus]|uniref:class I SAM-dependent DNA methyltransferase n=1 Tax=Acidithiobacillus caldus TaxID=33059 RepID=UPI001C06A253|nr:class I SAM-dependent DNA methyltransferase [Acidithiobacillus caldus]MBU2802672.1 SAM-dependent DNA methyltransferase [Acidithiobacillus caldus]